MEKTTRFLLIVCILTGSPAARAQDGYTLVGSARSASATDCYQLTPALDGQTGAVWFDKQLRLTESFELTLLLNFGVNVTGADGLAIVFQTQDKQILGGAGRGIGYKGLYPSLAIEFDTNFNPEEADPAEDHIALVSNGATDHRLNGDFASPVSIVADQKNVKDGRDHYVKIYWNAATHRLLIEVDCVRRIDQTIDLINSIFTGTAEIYWGFTAATGSRNNAHTVCVLNKQVHSDTVRACRNDQITLTAPLSSSGDYRWTPSAGLDNAYTRTPHLLVNTSQLYIVHYVDRCAGPKSDSVFVNAKGVDFSLGDDRQACRNDTISLEPTLSPGSTPVTYRWSTGQVTPQLNPTTSGQYSLTVTADGCSISDSVTLTFNPLPDLGLSNEELIYDCPGSQPIQLDPKATGTGLEYSWYPDEGRASVLMADTPGTYTVRITTDKGCYDIRRFTILDNCALLQVFMPDAFTPDGDGMNDLLKWQGGSNSEVVMKVFNRWGEVVFSSTASSLYWDGTYQGKPCQPDAYTWSLETRQQGFIRRGKVLLLKHSD